MKDRRKTILLLKLQRFVSILLDGLGALLLTIYALILGPLGVLRGPIVIERAFWYVSVLAPLGLLVRAVRAGIDWRLGHFSLATSQAESIIAIIEEHRINKRAKRATNRVLIDFYTLLTRAYLHMGHIDEAMVVVIRSKKVLGKDYLADLIGVDAKTAQLVRAGLSAGKLLEGEGLATLFVKTPAPMKEPSSRDVNQSRDGRGQSKDGRRKRPRDGKSSYRQGASGKESQPNEKKVSASNVIQFPKLSPSGDSKSPNR